ncbi:MAG: sugar ABC transporter permease, partial [Candidatus Latescibacteria bacterium]|nr:sugar ABC transporter permease [Candidatus Latescibacterota bacterium]
MSASRTKWNREAKEFYLFISPWLIGFIALTIGPMIFSIGLSFMRWDIITEPIWVGLSNYREMFFADDVFLQSLKVTTIYTIVVVPLHLLASLAVAMLLNQKVKAIGTWRTIFYLPSLLPAVAASMLFLFIFFKEGLLNSLVVAVGLPPQSWLQDEQFALVSLMAMSFWGFGAQMLIFLAGLQNIPQELYEASDIDGAGRWSKFAHVTVPSLSPVVFFNLVMAIIGTFQVFTQGFLI